MDPAVMKKKIVELIDDSRDNDRKIAFYSDENVQAIMDKLYGEWEKNNRKGIPLDYASNEELEVLYRLAKHYAENPYRKAYVDFMRRAYFGEKKEEKRSSWLKRILRII